MMEPLVLKSFVSEQRKMLVRMQWSGIGAKALVTLFLIFQMFPGVNAEFSDYALLLFVLFLLVLTLWPIPARTFIPTKKWISFCENFYEGVLRLIQFDFPEIMFLAPIGEMDVRMVNYSGLLYSSYEGFKGRNHIKGELDGKIFELCEAKIYQGLKRNFRGYFFQIDFDRDIESSGQGISDRIKARFKKQSFPDISEMKVSVKDSFLFISLETKRKLSFCKKKSQIRRIPDDVSFFCQMFGFLKEAAGLVQNDTFDGR